MVLVLYIGVLFIFMILMWLINDIGILLMLICVFGVLLLLIGELLEIKCLLLISVSVCWDFKLYKLIVFWFKFWEFVVVLLLILGVVFVVMLGRFKSVVIVLVILWLWI